MQVSPGESQDPVIIIGGGPAGLTAAYQLSKWNRRAVVIEKDSLVGGISRTVNYRGYHFDIGGHRFFTKVEAVDKLWREVLPEGEFLRRPRLSRIFYNRTFFHYPLRPLNALFGLGVWNSALIFFSYIRAQVFPQMPEDNFEQWVSNRFGSRLYRTFFKTYTEKVWGMPANTIAADWAAQRIKGLSLLVAIKNALIKPRRQGGAVVKTLIDAFDYPRRGPGMMWEAVAESVVRRGSEVRLRTSVERIQWHDRRVVEVEIVTDGKRESLRGGPVISSMPLRELLDKLQPPPPPDILQAAHQLKYRDFLTVALVVAKPEVFPDNWIYIHDPDVKVGRIQNFKNWSPDMVPDLSKTCLGLEYFCFEGDGLWTMSDSELIELGKAELERVGLACVADVEDGAVVRMPKAYPVYDGCYREALDRIRTYLDGFDNLQVVGRNGMHRYNNQDHSMLTAMLAVENLMGSRHDLWQVNAEEEYHEEAKAEAESGTRGLQEVSSTQPLVPQSVSPALTQRVMLVFARLDKLAFATACGVVAGGMCWFATTWIVFSGGPLAETAGLLAQFFPGYRVSILGGMIAGAYAFCWTFLWAWLFAYLRNFALGFIVYRMKRRAELMSFQSFLDHF